MLDFGFDDDARTRSETAVVDRLARMLRARAAGGEGVLTKNLLFSANCNDTPVVSDIVDPSLVALRNAKEVRILERKDPCVVRRRGSAGVIASS